MERWKVVLGGLVALAVVGGFAAWNLLGGFAEPPIELAKKTSPEGDRPAARPNLPHVVFLITCTTRRDQLTPYGAPANVTPFLAQVAAEGTRFEDVIAAAPWTKPASVALLSGLHPMTVGMVEPSEERNNLVLASSVNTLAERLWSMGYETFGVSGNPNLNTTFGLAQGFDGYQDSDGLIRLDKVHGVEVVARALELVDSREHPDRPLFLQAMFVDAHGPRATKAELVAPFKSKSVPRKLAVYRASVNILDQALESLLTGLERRGYGKDEVLLVVVSDHGEGLRLYKHSRSHGKTLYQSVTRVPWIVRGPGVARGHVVRGLASGVDVSTTILGLLGAPAPELAGRDWSPQVRGEVHETEREWAFSDTWMSTVKRTGVWSRQRACLEDFGSSPLNDPPWVEGCFERATDEGFERPLADPELTSELLEWRQARNAEREAYGETTRAEVDGDLNAQLEALGYMQ